ncbi:hypothetical protein [uncultured Methanomethylovorans sp.]|uniref:hypothetical protein n=1 Tax=uncultured Methanomethylovorans sp. TaxID=183759 RepID=UPI002AA8B00B|nr:hypothetical protein [uncultured Methanomethylovorans sp.]
MRIEFIDRKSKYEEFEADYRDAKAYHRRAKQFLEEGYRFSVVFNVASVALERYLVALCYLYNVEPINHNYTCLMDSVEEVVEIPVELSTEIRSLDLIFGICSIVNYSHVLPELSDAGRVLGMCDAVTDLFDEQKYRL